MKNENLIKYKNPVILKDVEGKGKPSIYDLPGGEHSYGKKIVDDPEPMKYVVNGWKVAQTSDKPAPKLKDYSQLNKQAVNSNLHTAKEQTDFRKTRDIMVQAKEGQKVMPIMLPNEEFTYGVGNRPSTPMKLVMGNCYALDAEKIKQQEYLRETEKLESGGKKVSARTTKSQALREQNVQKEKEYLGKPIIEEKFKLSKYTNLNQTKVDTGLSLLKKND